MEGLDPNLLAVMLFIGGLYFARSRAQDTNHTKSVQVDTELRERVKSLEEKVREQGDNSKSITRLEVLYQNMARDMHELRSWAQEMRMQLPLNLRRRERSPYDFDGRPWVEQDIHGQDWRPL